MRYVRDEGRLHIDESAIFRTIEAMRKITARGLDERANRIFRHIMVDWMNSRSPEASEIEPDIRSRLRDLLTIGA